MSDYTGTALAGTPFKGKITITEPAFNDRASTLTPTSPNSTLLNIELTISETETTSATGDLTRNRAAPRTRTTPFPSRVSTPPACAARRCAVLLGGESR